MAEERASYTVDAEPVLIQLSLDQGFAIGEFIGNTDPSKADFSILSLKTISYETVVPEIILIGLTFVKSEKMSFINFSPGIVFT